MTSMPAANNSQIPVAGGVTDWLVPVGAVALVFIMLVPLPGLILDVLLAISITASILVLLAAMQILRPAEFSVFPSLLLLLTLFRLSLNLASSRRILLHGNEGVTAAGHVIEAFGQFVVGGNYVVGFVLFLALIAIQYLVVSHGAVRTAEVTARFTLDAMPGKQMAIDADLNAGLIDENQARARREQVARESEFYGAMDGAARFNQRDALATVLVTAINIIAGFLIGVFQMGMPLADALKTYTVLTVGDGLVTMVPSLLVSVGGGIVLTRASSEATLGSDLGRQLLSRGRTLWIAAGVLFTLALIPGLPKLTFLAGATALSLLARRTKKLTNAPPVVPAAEKTPADPAEILLPLDDLSVEMGCGLVPLADERQGGQLLARVRALRRHLGVHLGFVIPPVHITDSLKLHPKEYVIALRGVEIARAQLEPDLLLAISSDPSPAALPGKTGQDPAFGVAATWITQNLRDQALANGYTVVDPGSVMATHLAEVVKRNAHDLLARSEAKRLMDRLSTTHPRLVEELVPKQMSLGEVHRVLQQLLREQVSIRDLPTILEALIDASASAKNPVLLVEAARQALARALVRPLLSADGTLRVVTLDAAIEEELRKAFVAPAATSSMAVLQPSFLRRMLDGLRRLLGENANAAAPILLCASPARFHLRRLLEPILPQVVVLSPMEIPAMIAVQAVGMVS